MNHSNPAPLATAGNRRAPTRPGRRKSKEPTITSNVIHTAEIPTEDEIMCQAQNKALFILKELEEEARILKRVHGRIGDQVHRLQIEEMILLRYIEHYERLLSMNVADPNSAAANMTGDALVATSEDNINNWLTRFLEHLTQQSTGTSAALNANVSEAVMTSATTSAALHSTEADLLGLTNTDYHDGGVVPHMMPNTAEAPAPVDAAYDMNVTSWPETGSLRDLLIAPQRYLASTFGAPTSQLSQDDNFVSVYTGEEEDEFDLEAISAMTHSRAIASTSTSTSMLPPLQHSVESTIEQQTLTSQSELYDLNNTLHSHYTASTSSTTAATTAIESGNTESTDTDVYSYIHTETAAEIQETVVAAADPGVSTQDYNAEEVDEDDEEYDVDEDEDDRDAQRLRAVLQRIGRTSDDDTMDDDDYN